MSETVDVLVLDLLEWLGTGSRPYAEVLESWQTSCPRLAVWEDANDRGFIERQRVPGQGELIAMSITGAEHLRQMRPRAVGHDRGESKVPRAVADAASGSADR